MANRIASRNQQLRDIANIWNIEAQRLIHRNLIDAPISGHIDSDIQNIPDLHGFLEVYGSPFSRAPIPVAQVPTYSHLFCPLIWRVIKLYKARLPEAEQKAIPEIPDEWLRYGHREGAENIGNLRNYRQTRNPAFFGIGNEAQRKFWDQQVELAVNDEDFINALKMYIIPPHLLLADGLIELQNSRIPDSSTSRSDISRPVPNSNTSVATSGITISQVRQRLGDQSDFATNANIQAAIQMYPRNLNMAVGTTKSMLGMFGGNKKRRQTKRKSRKQKRKSTYRRRR